VTERLHDRRATQQTYLEETLAYAKEQDNERTAAAVFAREGLFTAAFADCGIKPINRRGFVECGQPGHAHALADSKR
jgi:hypothetical protein